MGQALSWWVWFGDDKEFQLGGFYLTAEMKVQERNGFLGETL